jgi:hypothetical protein
MFCFHFYSFQESFQFLSWFFPWLIGCSKWNLNFFMYLYSFQNFSCYWFLTLLYWD